MSSLKASNEQGKRSQTHDFKLNIEQQVGRKIEHASKALMKVELNEEEIKIKPNSGNFKMLSEEVLKLKVGEKIKNNVGVAEVKDQHEQTDINGTPYMVKTEFLVTDVASGSNQKAVLHTYLSQTYFMIQGNGIILDKTFCKDFFFNCILKEFMNEVMKKKGREIKFINTLLKAQAKPVHTKQWK